MLVVFEKSNNYVVGVFSEGQTLEVIYQNNSSILERLEGIEVEESIIPQDSIRDYKLVDGNFVKKTEEETASKQTVGPTQQKILDLQNKNTELNSALAEASILLAEQEQHNLETQNAIAELSLLISTNGG